MADDEPDPAWDSLPEDRRKDLTQRMATFVAMIDWMFEEMLDPNPLYLRKAR